MKRMYVIPVFLLLLLATGCHDDSLFYPASAPPEIFVKRNELYALPGRKFVIRAELRDDLGLKTLKIDIPEFHLDKAIGFSADTLVTQYELAYAFQAPADTKPTDRFRVNLILTDVSGNSVGRELELRLDGDFQAPEITRLSPADGSVIFLTDNPKLDLSFDLADTTGIDSVIVEIEKLAMCEKIQLNGLKTYTFDRSFDLPSVPDTYEIVISAVDCFVEPNRRIQPLTVSVTDKLNAMFLADVPAGVDLTSDILGVPMYYHRKSGDTFLFKYYADRDNKAIYFLGQETSFGPHCFGSAGSGKLEKSISALPVVLPEKGYYEITVDPVAMTYTAARYTPVSPVYDPARITICGNGIESAGWDPDNTDLRLSADPDNPYRLERSLTLTGSDVAMTITSPGWAAPWWRLDEKGTLIFAGGNNYSYPGTAGRYKFIMDTELERAVLVKE